MSIGNVIQRDTLIFVYNEKGQQLFIQNAGHGPNDGLKGYTSHNVNIQRDGLIFSYNDKGQQIGVMPAR